MSVPKGARTEGQLQVMIELQALCIYTIQICKNEKNFPKRDRWILTQHIVKHAVDAYSLARQANAVRVSTMEDYKLRREYQLRCRTSLEALLGLIEIAYMCLGLDGSRVEFWTKSVISAERKIRLCPSSQTARDIKLITLIPGSLSLTMLFHTVLHSVTRLL